MKIIRYYPRAWRGDGGITNSVRRISEGLVCAGAKVSVAVDDDFCRNQNGSFSWLPVRHGGPPRFRRPIGLEEHLRYVDLLVLHSAWVYHNISAASIARRLGVPYVLEPRGAYDPSILRRRRALKRVWWRTLEQQLVQNAAAMHIFFESEQQHLRSIGYSGPFIVAPNGITPPADVRWDGGSGGYVLWIGRFDPEHKGLDLLLQAMRLLPESERPLLRLHGPDWVGGRDRVVQMVEQLQLAASVVVGDPVYDDEKWRLISQAAAFVYPSRWEGFGNSVAEAVSIGVPTLVTPYPFGRFLAERGGAILSEATPEGLAVGLRGVLSPTARSQGQKGARILESEFSWNTVARSWLQQAATIL